MEGVLTHFLDSLKRSYESPLHKDLVFMCFVWNFANGKGHWSPSYLKRENRRDTLTVLLSKRN